MWITSGVGRSDLAFHRSRTFRSCGPYEAFATSGGSEGLCCCCALSVNASHIKAAETGRRRRLMMDTLSQNQGLQWESPNARPCVFPESPPGRNPAHSKACEAGTHRRADGTIGRDNPVRKPLRLPRLPAD